MRTGRWLAAVLGLLMVGVAGLTARAADDIIFETHGQHYIGAEGRLDYVFDWYPAMKGASLRLQLRYGSAGNPPLSLTVVLNGTTLGTTTAEVPYVPGGSQTAEWDVTGLFEEGKSTPLYVMAGSSSTGGFSTACLEGWTLSVSTPPFELSSPADDARLNSLDSLSWSAGTYNVFRVLAAVPLAGRGYVPVSFWYTGTEVRIPPTVFQMFAPGLPCYWAVVGVNTITQESEVSEVRTFTRQAPR